MIKILAIIRLNLIHFEYFRHKIYKIVYLIIEFLLSQIKLDDIVGASIWFRRKMLDNYIKNKDVVSFLFLIVSYLLSILLKLAITLMKKESDFNNEDTPENLWDIFK